MGLVFGIAVVFSVAILFLMYVASVLDRDVQDLLERIEALEARADFDLHRKMYEGVAAMVASIEED